MTQTPTDALRLVPGKRLRPDARVLPGDVLRAVETFTNPDLLTKGDVVIVQSQGDDGNIVAFNLFRNVAQYGFNPTRYAFVHRPATRMKADYSHMLTAAPASPLPGGGWQDISTAPKDGTIILTYGSLHNDGAPYGIGETPSVKISQYSQEGEFWCCDAWGSHEPVWWMPLPAAPTGDA